MIDEGLSAFHNPALSSSKTVNFTLARWLFSSNHFSLGATLMNNHIGISYMNYGKIQGYDEFGALTNEFAPYNICFVIGRKIGAFGISIKTFSEKIDTHNMFGVCFSISSYLDYGNIAIGAKIDNLGKEFSKDTNIPWTSGTGVKYIINQFEFILETSIPDLTLSIGTAYTHDNACLLFGVKYLAPYNIIDDEPLTRSFSDVQLSSGLIISVDEYQIGYSFLYSEISKAHQFSITMNP